MVISIYVLLTVHEIEWRWFKSVFFWPLVTVLHLIVLFYGDGRTVKFI
jgi:hypothetical protein